MNKLTYAKREHIGQCSRHVVPEVELAGLKRSVPERDFFAKCPAHSLCVVDEGQGID